MCSCGHLLSFFSESDERIVWLLSMALYTNALHATLKLGIIKHVSNIMKMCPRSL